MVFLYCQTKFAHIIGVNDAFKDLALCNFEQKKTVLRRLINQIFFDQHFLPFRKCKSNLFYCVTHVFNLSSVCGLIPERHKVEGGLHMESIWKLPPLCGEYMEGYFFTLHMASICIPYECRFFLDEIPKQSCLLKSS